MNAFVHIKRSLGCIALLSSLSCSAQAEALLYGVVLQYSKEKREIISHVPIEADGANGTVTDSNGEFILKFRRHNPGDEIKLKVKPKGYVVVNKLEISRVILRNIRTIPISVVVSLPEHQFESALNYYEIKGYEALADRFNKALAEQMQRRRLTESELASITKDRDLQRRRAEQLAQDIAIYQSNSKSEIEGESEAYQIAVQLYLAGNFEGALAALNESDLEAQTVKAIEQSNRAAKSWRLRAGLQIATLDLEGAEHTYKKALNYLPYSSSIWEGYGDLNGMQGKYPLAQESYQKSIEISKDSRNSKDASLVLLKLGDIHAAEENYEEAANSALEAISIIRSSHGQWDGDEALVMATAYQRLADHYRKDGQYIESKNALNQALFIIRKAAQTDELYQEFQVTLLHNLGLVYKNEKDYSKAIEYYTEALSVIKSSDKAEEFLLPKEVAIGLILINLGNTYKAAGRIQDAEKAYEEAINTARKFAVPNNRNEILQGALKNYGILLLDEERYKEATPVIEEARDLYEEYAKTNPNHRYSFELLADIYNDLGTSYKGNQELDQAINAYSESIRLYRILAESRSDIYLPYVGAILMHLGDTFVEVKDINGARRSYEEADDIFKKLLPTDKEYFEPYSLKAQNRLKTLKNSE